MGFDDTWPNATAGGNDNDPPEEGAYLVALIDAGSFTSKAGDDYAKLGLRDTASGHEWDVLLGFGSQKQANVAKAACSTVGVDVDQIETLDELDTALKEHVGKFYDVTVKQNGEYRNTYIEGEADGSFTPATDVPADTADLSEEPVAAAAGAADDDDIPF